MDSSINRFEADDGLRKYSFAEGKGRNVVYCLLYLLLVIALILISNAYLVFLPDDKKLDIFSLAHLVFYGAARTEGYQVTSITFSMVMTAIFVVIVVISAWRGVWIGVSQERRFREQSSFSLDVGRRLREVLRTGVASTASGGNPTTSLLEPLRQMFGSRTPPTLAERDPMGRRWRDIESILEVEDLGQVSRKLALLPRELDGDRPAIASMNLYLMITLFAGIVGTFVGLMFFVVSPEIQDALENIQGSKELKNIFLSFQPAFASSLIAYSSYVFVRYRRDRADESFQVAVNDFNAEIQRPLKDLLHQVVGKEMVSLSPADAAMIKSVVEQVESVEKTLDTIAGNLRDLGDDLKMTAEQLDGAVTALTSQFGRFATSIHQTTSSWQEASDTFTETTAVFREAAANQLVDLRSALNEMGSVLSGNAKEIGSKFGNIQQQLENAVEKMSSALGGLDASLERVSENTAQNEEARAALETLIGDIKGHAAQLAESGRLLQAEIGALPSMVKPIVDGAIKNTADQAGLITKGLADLNVTIHQTNDRIGDYASRLAGGANGRDLLSVLDSLDRKIGNGTEWFQDGSLDTSEPPAS